MKSQAQINHEIKVTMESLGMTREEAEDLLYWDWLMDAPGKSVAYDEVKPKYMQDDQQ